MTTIREEKLGLFIELDKNDEYTIKGNIIVITKKSKKLTQAKINSYFDITKPSASSDVKNNY